jgi:PKD repeat protein
VESKIKRTITLLLAVCCLISLLPIVSFASSIQRPNLPPVVQVTEPNQSSGNKPVVIYPPSLTRNSPLTVTQDIRATPLTGKSPLTVQFHAPSVYKDVKEYACVWEFGDGMAASGEMNPVYTYKNPGNYVVNLKIIKHGDPTWVDTKSVTIHVSPSTSPFFKINLAANTVSGNAPLRVHFYDKSVIKDTKFGGRYWSFDDDHSSEEMNPVYTFTKGGFHEVTLEEWAYGLKEKKASIFIGVSDPNSKPCGSMDWIGGPSYCPKCQNLDGMVIETSDCVWPYYPGYIKIYY